MSIFNPTSSRPLIALSIMTALLILILFLASCATPEAATAVNSAHPSTGSSAQWQPLSAPAPLSRGTNTVSSALSSTTAPAADAKNDEAADASADEFETNLLTHSKKPLTTPPAQYGSLRTPPPQPAPVPAPRPQPAPEPDPAKPHGLIPSYIPLPELPGNMEINLPAAPPPPSVPTYIPLPQPPKVPTYIPLPSLP
ncbi:MAG: hypothetical protein SOW59_08155 [Corynebacterium sp.]|nr:hypothetical protein [Corynebacterium sp.]